MSAKVFITHSHHDIEFARRLSSDLAARSVEVWFEDTSLRGGERLAEEINRGLAWCDVYIPIITRAALASTWCWEEMNAIPRRPSSDRSERPFESYSSRRPSASACASTQSSGLVILMFQEGAGTSSVWTPTVASTPVSASSVSTVSSARAKSSR